MTKFQFNYLENKLSRVYPNNPEYSYVIPEGRAFTTQFGGQGFVLEPDFPQHWITFTVKSNKITVFYKRVLEKKGVYSELSQIIYYKRDFVKADIISFEFSEEDRVEKNENGWWVPKNSATG